jgi:hypothetical protein
VANTVSDSLMLQTPIAITSMNAQHLSVYQNVAMWLRIRIARNYARRQ